MVSDAQPKICTDSDDYGFLSRPLCKTKEPRVVIAPHSPRFEVINPYFAPILLVHASIRRAILICLIVYRVILI